MIDQTSTIALARDCGMTVLAFAVVGLIAMCVFAVVFRQRRGEHGTFFNYVRWALGKPLVAFTLESATLLYAYHMCELVLVKKFLVLCMGIVLFNLVVVSFFR